MKTLEELFKDLSGIMTDRIGLEESEIELKSNFINDLGFDSLDSLELIMDVESLYQISIPYEHAEKINTVQDAVNYLFDKLK